MIVQETLFVIHKRDACVPSPMSETIADVCDIIYSVSEIKEKILYRIFKIYLYEQNIINSQTRICLIRSVRRPVLRTQCALYAFERRGDVPLQQRLHRKARGEGRLPRH